MMPIKAGVLSLVCDGYRSLFGGLAQLGERLAGSQKVRGSSPLSSTKAPPLTGGAFFRLCMPQGDTSWVLTSLPFWSLKRQSLPSGDSKCPSKTPDLLQICCDANVEGRRYQLQYRMQ